MSDPKILSIPKLSDFTTLSCYFTAYRDTNQYNLLEFYCNDWILLSNVSHWGYNVTMKMNTIFLSGIPGEVAGIAINDKKHEYFSQMPQNKVKN